MKEPNKKTKPIGRGTVNITVNAPKELHQKIVSLAEESGVKMGEYIRRLLYEAAKKGVRFRVIQEESHPNEKKSVTSV